MSEDSLPKTPIDEMQKCTICDALVDPASLADVVFHFIDGACVTGGEKRQGLAGIRGTKVTPDA
ncbi:MAG: hypothetical protein JWO56_3393 [Acidobacteria bacterium]|nr:hypothetical protein [Acidobacteriota bacterium]